MKKLSTLAVAVIASALIFNSGCSKDRIEQEEQRSLNEYSSTNTNSYLDSKKEEEQEFVITGPGSCPLIGKRGTKICTGKECLEFPNGDSVSWPFTIKLVELYTPPQMIYYQMPTVAGGIVLETEGEIRLRAFKNGTELKLKSGGCYAQVEMKDSLTPQTNMNVFYGVNTSTFVDWVESNPVQAFTGTPYGYSAQITTLGWINCDKKIASTSTRTLSFVSTVDDLTNVAIFVYFPSTKTLMQVYNTVSGAIPDGSNVKIVALGVNAAGNLFSFYGTQTVNADAQIDATLSATTDADFTALLQGL